MSELHRRVDRGVVCLHLPQEALGVDAVELLGELLEGGRGDLGDLLMRYSSRSR